MKPLITLATLFALAFSGCAKKGESSAKTGAGSPAEFKPQTQCPVTGDPIKKEIFVDIQGQRVYFCDHGCAAEFSKDSEKYFKQFETDKILLESIQKDCPILGGAINPKIFRDYKGRRVYFCCEPCKAEFDKDPEGVLKKLPGLKPQEHSEDDGHGHGHEGHNHE